MIQTTQEMLDKIDMLDKILSALTVDEIKELFSHDLVVAKLKYSEKEPSTLLHDLVKTNNSLEATLMSARAELDVLKYDFTILLKTMIKPYDSYTISEFSSLKSKYGVY